MPPLKRQFPTKYAAGLLSVAVLAGCGGAPGRYVANPVNEVFSLSPSARAVNTNGQVQLKALSNTGGNAAVKWSVVRGENDPAIGQGSIDSRGVYTPPASVTRDAVMVEVQAQLKSDPARTATEILEVTPGFMQPLTPENAALSAGGSVLLTGRLAEVGGGTVQWRLDSSADGSGPAYPSTPGTLSQENCQVSARDYTVCSAVYSAPVALTTGSSEVYVIATGNNGGRSARQVVHVLLSASGPTSTPLSNQAVQTSMVQLGSSGGNNNDADVAKDSSGRTFVSDCCGGTLGALIRDESGSQYILSNNHVIAESDQAKLGDNIVQPGLIDRNCDQNAGRPVATLRYAVPLASALTNVDAALAEVNAGTVDPSGAILQLGSAGAGAHGGLGAAPPAAGQGQPVTPALLASDSSPLLVAKSGRTTGLTCSVVDAINLSIQVDYYRDCAETQPYYRKTFVDQIGIAGEGFSDSGDSGALVVNAANAQPLGLYFAGGTDGHGGGLSVASPIQDVLAELGSESGKQFSVAGGAEHPVSCLNYDSKAPALAPVTEAQRKRSEAVLRRYGTALVNPALGILGVEAGASRDAPGSATIVVYVDKTKENVPVPQTVGGLRTVVVATDMASVANGSAPSESGPSAGLRLPEAVLRDAREIEQASTRKLMSDPAIFGVGVTQSRDNPAEAALLILVDISRAPRSTPPIVGGLRTRYMALNRFHVTRSKYAGAHPSACSVPVLHAGGAPKAFDPQKPTPLPLP